MICENCHETAHHIFSDDTGERCESCSTISIISKSKTDGLLARTSTRVREQQLHHEGDMVLPHKYDKTSHRQRVNPDFVKLYPDKVKDYFNADQLKRDGYKKMPEAIEKNEARREKLKEQFKADTVYEGSSKKAIGKFLNE